MELFTIITNNISSYNVSVEVTDKVMTIINSNNNIRLLLYKEEYFSKEMTESFVEYIVEFFTQHRHFEADETNQILEYIHLILDDKVLPFEFYLDGKRRFGGEIKESDLNKLSVSFLSDKYGYINEYLLHFDYEIYSWSGKYNTGFRRVSDLKE